MHPIRLKIITPQLGAASDDPDWIATLYYKQAKTVVFKADINARTGLTATWHITYDNDKRQVPNAAGPYRRKVKRPGANHRLYVRGVYHAPPKWAADPPWYVEAGIKFVKTYYGDYVKIGRKAESFATTFNPDKHAERRLKAWNEGKLRWREIIRYPYEFSESEDYRDWLTYNGIYAYVDDRDAYIKRLEEYEQLTGESLQHQQPLFLKYLDEAAAKRAHWKATQLKI